MKPFSDIGGSTSMSDFKKGDIVVIIADTYGYSHGDDERYFNVGDRCELRANCDYDHYSSGNFNGLGNEEVFGNGLWSIGVAGKSFDHDDKGDKLRWA